MEQDRNYSFINDILSEINNIRDFIEGITEDEFLEDLKSKYAVAKSIENIGEATKSVPDTFKIENPEIPWAKMYGVRNRITHEYTNTDFKIVWHIATLELPKVEQLLEQALLEHLSLPRH